MPIFNLKDLFRQKKKIFNIIRVEITMKKRITKCFVIMAVAICFPFGCFLEEKGTTYKTETVRPSVYIKIPAMQHTFTEGYPKELIAKTYSNESHIAEADFIWTSDLDGEIGQGMVITTDVLSLGEHVITLTAYDENENAYTSQIKIKKVKRPSMPEIEKKDEKPIIYVDRVDGTTYIDLRDGTVLDKNTNLMWLITDDGYDRQYAEAYNYCLDLEFAEYEDWRLPMLDELEDLANIIGYHKIEPVLCEVFDAKNGGGYWTQTESDFSISSLPNVRSFTVVRFRWKDNIKGFVGETEGALEIDTHYSRCVRAAR